MEKDIYKLVIAGGVAVAAVVLLTVASKPIKPAKHHHVTKTFLCKHAVQLGLTATAAEVQANPKNPLPPSKVHWSSYPPIKPFTGGYLGSGKTYDKRWLLNQKAGPSACCATQAKTHGYKQLFPVVALDTKGSGQNEQITPVLLCANIWNTAWFEGPIDYGPGCCGA